MRLSAGTALPPFVGCALRTLDARLDRASKAPVALALSGGGDSLALLRLAADWCGQVGRPLLALTVDHRLHPDSAAWTLAAGGMARAAGALWRSLAWTDRKPATGLPAAARAARHGLIADAAREAGARVVLFAHTGDDAWENARLRTAAPTLGALREWSPSPAWPQGRGLMLLRPLLQARRGEIRTWLAAQSLAWIDDPANADLSHPRVRARREGGWRPQPPPPPPPSSDATCDGWGLVRFDRVAPLDARALGVAAAVASGAVEPARGATLARAVKTLTEGGVDVVLGGARLRLEAGRVTVGRELGRRPPAASALAPNVPIAWDGRFEVKAAEPGWRVTSLAGHAARLSDSDRARLREEPAALRPGCPVFLRDDGHARLADGEALELRALGPDRLDLAMGRVKTEAGLQNQPFFLNHHSGSSVVSTIRPSA